VEAFQKFVGEQAERTASGEDWQVSEEGTAAGAFIAQAMPHSYKTITRQLHDNYMTIYMTIT